MVSLCSVFFYKLTIRHKGSGQAEFIPSTFDIHYSIFDIRFFRVSFSIKLAAAVARGGAEPLAQTWLSSPVA